MVVDVTETQLSLFTSSQHGEAAVLLPRDPNVAPADRPRLTGQNAAILARLKQGPATNRELRDLVKTMNHTARISDLRDAGHTIECHRGKGGLNTYELRN